MLQKRGMNADQKEQPEGQRETPETKTINQDPVPVNGTGSSPGAGQEFPGDLLSGNRGGGRNGGGRKWALREAEPWPEPVDGAALLDELAGTFRGHVVLPKWSAEALALWNIHTYAFQLREVCTYLGIESPVKRCGKTTLLEVLCELVNRPVVAANISSPAFFRAIEEKQPTLLLDEGDTLLMVKRELNGILNSGYKQKMAYVVRVERQKRSKKQRANGGGRGGATDGQFVDGGSEGEGQSEGGPHSDLVSFSSWCPKAMAAIGHLSGTLEDRCIIIPMQRKTPDEKCAPVKDLDGTPLRRRCARFVLDHQEQIAKAEAKVPGSLNDRAAEIWEPLLVLADLAGGRWPELARQAAEALTARAEGSNPFSTLLVDILALFSGLSSGRVFTRKMVKYLSGLEGRPWAETLKSKQLTDIWLSGQLRPYGIQPRTMRIGEERAKGYYKEDFADVFRRYLSRSDLAALKAELMQEGELDPEKEAGGGTEEKKKEDGEEKP